MYPVETVKVSKNEAARRKHLKRQSNRKARREWLNDAEKRAAIRFVKEF